MCSSKIEKLYGNISLVDKDEVVLEMTEVSRMDGVDDVDWCLVGKVLLGKKVNREAFKDRNRVWRRGPWHFGNSLIALEKPIDTGNISKLGFNRANFWIQIHDIPILCMNRRTARWLAEQLGEVVEILLESRDCWGKFMRVKVSIDITKPLKRWLKLKSGTSEEIIMVGLKYERLLHFCYACGRIGHGIKECMDEVARKAGTPTKFGSWLKASTFEKGRPRFNSKGSGGSSDRSRSLGASRDTTKDGPVSVRPKSLTSHGDIIVSVMAAAQSLTNEIQLETLIFDRVNGPLIANDMCVDGSEAGFIRLSKELAQPSRGTSIRPPTALEAQDLSGLILPLVISQSKPGIQVTGIISSPLHRILGVKQSIQKTFRGKPAFLHQQRTVLYPSWVKVPRYFVLRPPLRLLINVLHLPLWAPGTMIGLSWNVRGLGNPCAIAALLRLLKHHSPGLVFLSETKSNSFKAERIRVSLDFNGSLCVDSVGNSDGLLLLWKHSNKVLVVSFSSGHIDARVCKEDGFLWRFIGFYGEPNASKRHVSWALLRRLKDINNLPWVCGSDFNERLSMNDKVGGSNSSVSSMIQFRQVVDYCNLTDLGFFGPSLTWNNIRDGRDNIQERLDRFLYLKMVCLG
ncbi:hypothetical protein EZV62_023915 [Acer yangbiense]|uniref:CCHC-type domain-containing protein n=1 Tax=Acer yangbiense TaxID=1000413 RepID=A0A5C7H399_9ROSI|nr:hypothetical protein EZV62_023915 [Acer yangbiense]